MQIQKTELKANTMFRLSIIVCVSLICGITARPHKPLSKLTAVAFQDVVMSMNGEGMPSFREQVEPPEDMDRTNYDVDPRMTVWESMTDGGQDKPYLKAEEDSDELYHTSMTDRLREQVQKLGALPDVDWAALSQEHAQMKNYQEPEEDRDDIDHPVFFTEADSQEPEEAGDEVSHNAMEQLRVYMAPYLRQQQADGRVSYSEPEEDKDELYHPDVPFSPVQVEPLKREVKVGTGVRLHLEPEEDMDDLYHKVVLQPVPYRVDAPAALLADVPSERKHTEPEEDLDHLYHN